MFFFLSGVFRIDKNFIAGNFIRNFINHFLLNYFLSLSSVVTKIFSVICKTKIKIDYGFLHYRRVIEKISIRDLRVNKKEFNK